LKIEFAPKGYSVPELPSVWREVISVKENARYYQYPPMKEKLVLKKAA